MIVTQRERERGRDTGRGRSRLHAGSPTWDLILGPRGHALNQRQMLNRGATRVPLETALVLSMLILKVGCTLTSVVWGVMVKLT